MSLGNEGGSSAMEASESINESEKKPRVSYTREFLLSLSELEICKKLPSGFDQSIPSELDDNSIQERTRPHENLPLQGFRRNDYSSSPPTRGDSSSFSRGVYGRWDNRSSAWNDKDKDGDSQSDLDPDSGRRNYGNNQSRRPWQNPEHDGLLGSGSFPRPSGFAPGTSAPKSQTNDHHHLSRSNEAYQPPRPFKAVPHARTNTHDSFNDETFGSSDTTSQDRAEEERKRRASFELMRKEQQKVLQEKQKSSGNKLKSDAFSDLILEESKEEGVLEVQSVPNDDSGKLSGVLQSTKPRPLVPPGFRTTKPITTIDKENPKPGIEEIHLVNKGTNHTQNGTLDNIMTDLKQGEAMMTSSSVPVVLDAEVFELNKILTNSTQETSTSILGKFFGTSPSIKDSGPTSFLEQKSKPDDPLSPSHVQSSRFAQWFNEDEKKPVEDNFSSTRPNDLLSLIVGGEKSTNIPNIIPTDPITPFGLITKTPSDSNQLYNNYKKHEPTPPVAAVLTCEDLEQTILSEYTEKSSTLPPPPVPEWAVPGQESQSAIPVDNHATNHLLSLLQKGTSIEDNNKSSSEIHPISEKPKDEPNSNLSLESLFGSAFMKELQSAQAPVSAQRGTAGSARIDLFETGTVDGMPNYENTPNLLLSKQKQPVKSDNNPESWFNGADRKAEIGLPEEESLIDRDPLGISEKPAALNSGFRGEQFLRGPHDVFNNNNNVHGQGPSPQMVNQNRRPMFQQHGMDVNSQMRFPEHLMQRQQFPGGPFQQHHPDTRVTGFDVPGHHPQMLPPPQMRFPRPLGNNFMGEREVGMHGVPFNHHQQSNIGGHGLPLPGGVGDGSNHNHPEMLQRMMEMEMRAQAQAKQQIRPGGMYNELDMGFRYR